MPERFKILVTDPLHPDGLDILRRDGRVELMDATATSAGLRERWIAEADAWLIRSSTRVDAQALERAARLKVIARAGVGVDNVDVAAATHRGVLVMNAPDANAITTAELTIAHLFSIARHLVQGDRMVRSGRWSRSELIGTELEGKVLGLIGLGRIGRRVARKAQGLGMRVIGHDPYLPDSAAADLNVTLTGLQGVLAEADFLSLHVPLTDATRALLNAETLRHVKPGLRLVNCARGGLIDEAALLDALEEGRVAYAALDVFSAEPVPADHPLLKHPRVVTTPHLGASTEEASRNVSVAVAAQTLRYLESGDATSAVNFPPLSGEAAKSLGPFVALARQSGRFVAQVVDWPVTRVDAEYRGELGTDEVRPLSSAFLQGLLTPVLDAPVNLVNARVLAEERGITLVESRSRKLRDFQSLLDFRLETRSGPRRVAGALFGKRMPRIVRLDEARLEIVPEGHLLVLRNQDRPGVIGRIGTLLGQADVNIGNMHVSGPGADGLCYAVLSVSPGLPGELLRQVRSLPEIADTRSVALT